MPHRSHRPDFRLPRHPMTADELVARYQQVLDAYHAMAAALDEATAERDDLRTEIVALQREGGGEGGAAAGGGAAPSELEAVRAEAAAARREADEYLAGLQRERAEFQNFRRRSADERQRDLGFASEELIRKVLTLADDFDLAIAGRPGALASDPWAEGIAAIDRKLRTLLESEGVKALEAEPGRPFDPREHEAVTSVPGTEHPEGAIVGEVRRGYRLGDRVIRPALVAVAASSDEPTPAAATANRPPNDDHKID